MKIPRPALMVVCVAFALCHQSAASEPFGIHVVDEATGRGVPMVTLTTVNQISLITDSAGWAAFNEPGLMNTRVFFSVSSPGYEFAKDGFGYAGKALQTTPGATERLTVRRLFPAERLCRLSGQGIYRDSHLLGRAVPHPRPLLDGNVIGLDSVQVTPFQGGLLWIWGDTSLPGYPIGNFHATGAFSDLPSRGGMHPAHGIVYDYFTDPATGSVKKLAPMDKPGPVWLFGLLTVNDDAGVERVVAHYSRHKNLAEIHEHGLMAYDPAQRQFVKTRELPLEESWRFPRGHALRVTGSDGDHFYFCDPFPVTRVAARLESVTDPNAFEALQFDSVAGQWIWQKEKPPLMTEDEAKLLKSGAMSPGQARLQIRDPKGETVLPHGGTLQWNPYRQRWVLVFIQKHGKASFLGELWYAESRELTGPWGPAVQIASHPRQSFYNPAHHAALDQQNGRFIHIEGTYTHTFSGNPEQTPRYDYNQFLYRLDLDDPRLQPARVQ